MRFLFVFSRARSVVRFRARPVTYLRQKYWAVFRSCRNPLSSFGSLRDPVLLFCVIYTVRSGKFFILTPLYRALFTLWRFRSYFLGTGPAFSALFINDSVQMLKRSFTYRIISPVWSPSLFYIGRYRPTKALFLLRWLYDDQNTLHTNKCSFYARRIMAYET